MGFLASVPGVQPKDHTAEPDVTRFSVQPGRPRTGHAGRTREEDGASDPAIDPRGDLLSGGALDSRSDPWSGRRRAVSLDRVEVLVFAVGGREHALPVEDVIEVVRMVAVTPLPEAPPWIAGVVNMRGRLIPVVDLRTRLGMPPREPGLSTPIIVVGRGEAAAGLIADSASEVLALSSTAVQPPHRQQGSAPAVSGMAREGDRLILLLDTQRLCDGTVHLPMPSDLPPKGDAAASGGR